ncbi:MAG: antibiotic biosynthesis monooxygenase family protein [Paracoccaceae bacterium]
MIAVIFEVVPAEGQRDRYLDLAGGMRALAEGHDGFVSVERFQSLTDPSKLLSISFWRDEEALDRWRRLERHRAMQSKGREELFAGYRLRVAHVLRDYGMEAREEAPADSRAVLEGVPGGSADPA